MSFVLFSLILSSSSYAESEESSMGDCVPLEVKVFGIKILNKYHSGCPLSSLPDGRWDWFPKN